MTCCTDLSAMVALVPLSRFFPWSLLPAAGCRCSIFRRYRLQHIYGCRCNAFISFTGHCCSLPLLALLASNLLPSSSPSVNWSLADGQFQANSTMHICLCDKQAIVHTQEKKPFAHATTKMTSWCDHI
jgi:hypothetical protein